MKNKKPIFAGIIAIIIIVVAAILFFNKSEKKAAKASPKNKVQQKVDAYIVKPELLINEISVYGSLVAFEEVELKNEVSGRVVKVNLPEGKFVKKGTLLVKLNDEDLQANLKKLQSQLALNEQINKRQSELLRVNGISKNDYEQTLLQVNSIKADIEVVKANIRKTEVWAPFDGLIGLRNISEGAIVTPSTLLATIRTENKLKLDFFVPEKYGAYINQGLKVKFTMYNNNKEYDATIIATEQGIDDATRNLKARAIVNSNSKELIPGAYATVKVHLGENQNALMIPSEAIIPKEGKKSVIVARDGKAKIIDVSTGVRQSSKIEILSGLIPGDTVITSGILFLKNNSKLQYSSVK